MGRILIVPWDYTVPESQQIKDLANEICRNELPGIFNWALEGLKQLNRNNGFVTPSRNKEIISEYRRDSDPVRAFLEDHYDYALNAYGRGLLGRPGRIGLMGEPGEWIWNNE